ncbi:hypothetical protein Pcinc_042677 [Petrolisthes cinctipes]|uniref:Uncharacterized protein n=2 Tax=Petrolisthes cinctipes TaxID=88211 RepID=A0AAE1BH01_PETCI|nr:hypothetical protein Pcinc_042677 [Petrolisthes cinctipes]
MRLSSLEEEEDLPIELPKETTTTTTTSTTTTSTSSTFFGLHQGKKVQISSFPKDSYWFRSQKDREDTFMETRAETICTQNGKKDDDDQDDNVVVDVVDVDSDSSLPPCRRVSRGGSTNRVVFVGEDETSFT